MRWRNKSETDLDAVDPRVEFAYDEGVRLLDSQAKVLADFSSRVVQLFAAGAIVAGFLAPVGIGSRSDVSNWALGAVGCYLVLTGITIYLMTPSRGWVFNSLPTKMLAEYVEGLDRTDIEDMVHSLAVELEKRYDSNARKLTRRMRAFSIGCLLLAGEVLLFVIDIWIS